MSKHVAEEISCWSEYLTISVVVIVKTNKFTQYPPFPQAQTHAI
jgi:hypothetical protein